MRKRCLGIMQPIFWLVHVLALICLSSNEKVVLHDGVDLGVVAIIIDIIVE